MFKKLFGAIGSVSNAIEHLIAAIDVFNFAKDRFEKVNAPKEKQLPVEEAVNADG
jgi:hypothetical protein